MTTSFQDGSHRTEALSTLAMASHEVRGALAAIISHAELLADRTESPHESRTTARLIERHGRAVLETFDSILRSAHQSHEQSREPASATSGSCDLRSMIEELILLQTPRARAAGLSLEATIAEDIPGRLGLAAGSLPRILSNLVENALKYTSDGGIHVRAQVNARGHLSIEVEDTGPGIEPSEADRIFETFVRSDRVRNSNISGVGLGLSLCRDLARTMDADLTVRSGGDGGSIFQLSFPGSVLHRRATDESLRGVGILMLDDCTETLRLNSTLLASQGASIVPVGDARSLMHEISRNDRSFDVILVDLEMPDLDGWEVRNLLREHACTLPVLALTAHRVASLHDRALEQGFAGLIEKPLDPTRLAELIVPLFNRNASRLAG